MKWRGLTRAVLFTISHSSNNPSKLILSVVGKNSTKSALPKIAYKSSSHPYLANLFATLTSVLVPSFLFFWIASLVKRRRYFSAKVRSVEICWGDASVRARMSYSSEGDMGWEGMVKSMEACSSVSQSARGADLEAVTIIRKDGWATVSSPVVS